MTTNVTVHLSLRSNNQKTGPIPVSTTSSNSCPPDCEFRGYGCYAEYGPLALHWRQVSAGARGANWAEFCETVADMNPGQLWRHNQAGDLPHKGGAIDRAALDMLVAANFGRRGFTYTHHDPDKGGNGDLIALANLCGFTVNLSSNDLEEADRRADSGAGPVVTVMPADATENCKTPKGRTVVVCPATQRSDVNCLTCQLCARQRDSIVGFPAHGTGAARVDRIARRVIPIATATA